MEKKLFIAIKINPSIELYNIISDIKNTFKYEKINWVDKENTHLTLRFLGKTEEDKISIISEQLDKICKKNAAFELTIKQLGVFPNFKKPRIMWFGFLENKELITLQSQINELFKEMNFKHDNFKYKPHFTVGRIKFLKNRKLLNQQIKKYSEQKLQTFEVTEFNLYESVTVEGEVEYKIIDNFKLV